MFGLEITPNTILTSAEIQGTVPALNFADVTSGDEDWRLYADGDSFYILNTTDSLNALIFDGSANATFLADTTVSVDKLTLLDTNNSHSLGLIWNENDTSARTLNLLVGGGDRSLTLSENFTIGDGYNVTITAEDIASTITLDKQTFEVEGEQTATQLTKIINAQNAAATLTLEGTASVINQDLTSDATPTLAGLLITTGGIIKSNTANGHTMLLAANDTTFITFTTAATDTCAIAGASIDNCIIGASTAVAITGTTITANTSLTMADAGDIVLNTTTGSKIGTGNTQKIGFWNAAPVVQSTGWAVSNVTADKVFDANATSLDEISDVVGTLITWLLSCGLVGA